MTEDAIRTAARNAVTVASIAHPEALDGGDLEEATREHATSVSVLRCAHGKGLAIRELCQASGLDEPFIRSLLEGASAA